MMKLRVSCPIEHIRVSCLYDECEGVLPLWDALSRCLLPKASHEEYRTTNLLINIDIIYFLTQPHPTQERNDFFP